MTFKMSYSKCGLCLQDLEVIKPASGIPYIRCLNWKECPFFCAEESIHGYQQCVCDRVIPEYKVFEGGKQLLCKHLETPTLRVSRSVKNPFRPYFTCRRNTCRYFQWADEISVDMYSARGPPVYEPREKTKMDMMQRPKLMRQFARIDKVTYSM